MHSMAPEGGGETIVVPTFRWAWKHGAAVGSRIGCRLAAGCPVWASTTRA